MTELAKLLSTNLNVRSGKLADAALSLVPKSVGFLQDNTPSLKAGIKAAGQLASFYASKKISSIAVSPIFGLTTADSLGGPQTKRLPYKTVSARLGEERLFKL
jgi:hypothetical protein